MGLLFSSNTEYGDRTLEVIYKDGSSEKFEISQLTLAKKGFLIGLQESKEEVWINKDSLRKMADYKEGGSE